MLKVRSGLYRTFIALALSASFGLLPLAAFAANYEFTIHGTVSSERTGAPIADAKVELILNGWPRAPIVLTAADGSYSWSGAWDLTGAWHALISVTALGHIPRALSFNPMPGDILADFALEGTTTISGSVRDSGGATVDAVIVRVTRRAVDGTEWLPQRTVVTSPEGFYQAAELPPGTYRVCAGSARYHFVQQCFSGIEIQSALSFDAATPISLAEMEWRDDINFTLKTGGTLTGTLIDTDSGGPITDIDVTMDLYDLNGTLIDSAVPHTDAAGVYQLRGVPNGSFYLKARVGHGHWGTQLFPGIDCPSGDCPPITNGQLVTVSNHATVAGIDFTFVSNVTVRGVISDSSGAPLAGVVVFACTNTYLYPQCLYRTESNLDGSYALHVNGGWAYMIAVRAGEEHADQTYPDITCDQRCGYPDGGMQIPVQRGDRIDGINFSLPGSSRLSGVVRDSVSGAPVAGSVSVYDAEYRLLWSTSIDPDGTYRGQKWIPGTFYVSASSYELSPACAFYLERPCPEPGEPISSVEPTPVVVGPGQRRTDIDISLSSARIFGNGFELR